MTVLRRLLTAIGAVSSPVAWVAPEQAAMAANHAQELAEAYQAGEFAGYANGLRAGRIIQSWGRQAK